MNWALESTLGLPFAFQWPRSTLRFTERLKLSATRKNRWTEAAQWRYNNRHMAKAKRASVGFKHCRRKEGDQKASISQRSMTIESVRAGLSVEWLVKVASELRVPGRTLAEVLNISSRTFDRRLKGGVLSPTESDSLARVARLLDRATEIFGSVEKARGWMSTPLAALEGETPLQRADTSVGAMQVDDLLGRIDYGVYS